MKKGTRKSYKIRMPEKYGVVYTPPRLSDFVARLLTKVARQSRNALSCIIDPACGEGSLLNAVASYAPSAKLIGIDVDASIAQSMHSYDYFETSDFLLPSCSKPNIKSVDFWHSRLPSIDAIIANPPWSSNRIYEKRSLISRGFTIANGQYDCYELFVELGIQTIRDNGLFAFILPDSLYSPEKALLRKWLLENTQLKIVARLGEKIFPEVFRATTVIVGKKAAPKRSNKTLCYRLDTEARNSFLKNELDLYEHFIKNAHIVSQYRFVNNPLFNLDVDATEEDVSVTNTILKSSVSLGDVFVFGRGVEISKNGLVVTCPKCKTSQGIRRISDTIKFVCKSCRAKITTGQDHVNKIVRARRYVDHSMMWVGESLNRYALAKPRFIKTNVMGIDYKTQDLFSAPKLLIRKTGLGIYAAVDLTDTMTNQTVYVLRARRTDSDKTEEELFYYLAFINSRTLYYYYQKMYGAAEWKSHPYLTKQVLFSLPVPEFKLENQLDCDISAMAKELMQHYNRKIDLSLETLVAERYGLNDCQFEKIKGTMATLPDLTSIKDMKF